MIFDFFTAAAATATEALISEDAAICSVGGACKTFFLLYVVRVADGQMNGS